VNYVLAPTLPPTIHAVVWALDDAARLCSKGFEALGHASAPPFSAPAFSLADTPLATPPDVAGPMALLSLERVNEMLEGNKRVGRETPLGYIGRPAPAASYFTFTIAKHPGQLRVTWPVSPLSLPARETYAERRAAGRVRRELLRRDKGGRQRAQGAGPDAVIQRELFAIYEHMSRSLIPERRTLSRSTWARTCPARAR
jgi:hypothetical protein